MQPEMIQDLIKLAMLLAAVGVLIWIIICNINKLLELRNDAITARELYARTYYTACPLCHDLIVWTDGEAICQECGHRLEACEIRLVDPAEVIRELLKVQGEDYETLLNYRSILLPMTGQELHHEGHEGKAL